MWSINQMLLCTGKTALRSVRCQSHSQRVAIARQRIYHGMLHASLRVCAPMNVHDTDFPMQGVFDYRLFHFFETIFTRFDLP